MLGSDLFSFVPNPIRHDWMFDACIAKEMKEMHLSGGSGFVSVASNGCRCRMNRYNWIDSLVSLFYLRYDNLDFLFFLYASVDLPRIICHC